MPHGRSFDGCHGSASRALSPPARHPSLNPTPDARKPSLSSAQARDNLRATTRCPSQTRPQPAPHPPRTARLAPDPCSIPLRNPAPTAHKPPRRQRAHAPFPSPLLPKDRNTRPQRSPSVHVSHHLRTHLPSPQPSLHSHFAIDSLAVSCTKPARTTHANTNSAGNSLPNPPVPPQFPNSGAAAPVHLVPSPTLAKRAS